MKHSSLRALAAALALQVTTAQAVNPLQNPDFDTDIALWSATIVSGGAVTFNPNDGSPNAGSAQLVVPSTSSGADAILAQCVPAIGTPPWDFGARLRVVSSSGSPFMLVATSFYSGANCTGTPSSPNIAIPGGSVAGVQGTFTAYTSSVATDPMPGGSASQSVMFEIAVFTNTNNDADSGTVNADTAYFVRDVIFANGFEN